MSHTATAKKRQIVVIHGGNSYDTYEAYLADLRSAELSLERLNSKDWKDTLSTQLPEFEVIYPKMPNSKNAHYLEWKIWFEKLIPLLNDEAVFVGHSRGGIFLAKYLTENEFPKRILSLHLVAAPYDTELAKQSLGDFALTSSVERLSHYTDQIFIYQSKDDVIVAYADALKYQRDLPSAQLISFEDRGHFNQEDFPELIERIK